MENKRRGGQNDPTKNRTEGAYDRPQTGRGGRGGNRGRGGNENRGDREDRETRGGRGGRGNTRGDRGGQRGGQRGGERKEEEGGVTMKGASDRRPQYSENSW